MTAQLFLSEWAISAEVHATSEFAPLVYAMPKSVPPAQAVQEPTLTRQVQLQESAGIMPVLFQRSSDVMPVLVIDSSKAIPASATSTRVCCFSRHPAWSTLASSPTYMEIHSILVFSKRVCHLFQPSVNSPQRAFLNPHYHTPWLLSLGPPPRWPVPLSLPPGSLHPPVIYLPCIFVFFVLSSTGSNFLLFYFIKPVTPLHSIFCLFNLYKGWGL